MTEIARFLPNAPGTCDEEGVYVALVRPEEARRRMTAIPANLLLVSRPSPEPLPAENELLRRAAAGDRAALDAALRRAAPTLLRVCTRLLGNREDGLDALQDGFVRISGSLHRYDPRRPARPWMTRVAVRAAQDLRRKRSRRSWLLFLGDDTPPRRASGPDPEVAVAGAQLGRRLEDALSVLGPKERDAFVLRHLEGHDTADVADLLGVRETTVRGHCLQARRKLRARLERTCPELLDGAGGPR